MFGKWAKRRDLGSCHQLGMQQVPTEGSRRPPVHNPAGKSCQFSKQDGKQQIPVTTLCVKLGKFPWEGEVLSPSLHQNTQSLLPGILAIPVGEPWNPWGLGWFGLFLAAGFVRHLQMMDFMDGLLL